IILLTGAESPEADLAASSAGAADYLDKNQLDTSRLERAIRYSLRHAATLQALHESQRQLELFMKHVPCAIGIQDEDGRYLYVNDTFSEMVGQPKNDLIGRRKSDLWPELNAEKDSEQEREVFPKGPKQAIEPLLNSSQQRHWLTNRFPMIQEDAPPLLGLAAIDITERVMAEERLRQTTQLLDGIVNNLPVIAGRLDE